jgi:uncharacterized protein YhfF
MKKIIRLTESDLHRIVKESVKRVIRESYDWEQSGEINIADRVFDTVMEGVEGFTSEKLRNYLEEVINLMDEAGIFTIEFTIDTRSAEPNVESMTTTDEVMKDVIKYIGEGNEEIINQFRIAVDDAINGISDDDLKNNVEYYWYDNYDFYGDPDNFLPRSV